MSREKSPAPTSRERIALHARRAFDTAQPALVQWVKGGAALGVARTGAKVVLTVAKRNPAVFVAAGVLGAGVLAYRFYRKRNPEQAIAGDDTAAQGGETSSSARRRAIEGTGEVIARRQPVKAD